jgi:hypothetical protein
MEREIFIMISINTFELGYNVIKGAEYFVSLQTSVVLTDLPEECTVMVHRGINWYKVSGDIDEVSHKSMSL